MSNCFIATTKGFDEFYLKNPSVVGETRLYPIIAEPLKGIEREQNFVTIYFHLYDHSNANYVEVRGSWDEWKNSIPLEKDGKGVFRGTASIAPGSYTYKFIVDGNWVCDKSKPTVQDGDTENNFLKVSREVMIYNNMMYPRSVLNSIHKKIALRYPEFYLYTLVHF